MSGRNRFVGIVLLIAGLLFLSACGAQRLRVQSEAAAIRTGNEIAAGKIDEYVVEIAAGRILAVNIVSPNGDVLLAIEGKDDGVPLATAASNGSRWSGAVPSTQDYLIRVMSSREDTDYVLGVAALSKAEDLEAPEANFIGMYHMTAPHAHSMRDLTLILDVDGYAALMGVSIATNPATFVMQGTWQADGSIATVELTEQNGQAFLSPETFRLEWRDGLLAVTGGDASSWRTAGLLFTPARGDHNLLVRELHNRLIALGYMENPRPQYDAYTELTRRAVVALQNGQGMVPHGVADAATWAALDIALLPERTPAGEPIVYLTFDDGPDGQFTPQILNLLAQYNAQATFFILGEQALYYPDLIRAEAEAGHYVASHGYSHKSLDNTSREEFSREVQRADKLLRDVAGDLFAWDGDIHYLRPPYGLTDADAQQYAAEFGYVMVMWDVDSHDWKQPGGMQIVVNVLNNVQPGDIVLMHDGGGDRSQTVAALQMILQQLSAQGYKFKSIFGD